MGPREGSFIPLVWKSDILSETSSHRTCKWMVGRWIFLLGVPPIFHVRTVSLRECNSLKIPFSRTLVYGSNHPGSFFVGKHLGSLHNGTRFVKHTARQFVSKLSPNWDEVALGNAAMTSKNTGSDLQVLQEGLLGGSSQDLDTWLGSPPFISHKYRPFWNFSHNPTEGTY